MKKILTILPLALMLFGCQAKDTTVQPIAENTTVTDTEGADMLFHANSLELILSLDEMAESEEYRKLFSASDEVGAIISDMGAGDYSSPKAIYKINEIELNQNSADLSTLPVNLQEKVKKKMIGAIPTMLNSVNGTESLAASSIITDTKYFNYPAETKPYIYLYAYDGNYSIMLLYMPYNDNLVGATGYFVTNNSFDDISSANSIARGILSSGYVSNCNVEEID